MGGSAAEILEGSDKQPDTAHQQKSESIFARDKIAVQDLGRPESRCTETGKTADSAGKAAHNSPDKEHRSHAQGNVKILCRRNTGAEHAENSRQHQRVAEDVRKHGDIIAVAGAVFQQGSLIQHLGDLIIGFVIGLRGHRHRLYIVHTDCRGYAEHGNGQYVFSPERSVRMLFGAARYLQARPDYAEYNQQNPHAQKQDQKYPFEIIRILLPGTKFA